VVFTNGCFDLLHVGHVRCLQDAARRGDFLVIALNSDASIRRLKGPERPLQPEEERAEMLCALNGVSYVTIFDEESCGGLLRLLRPQVVAKGTDYSLATLPERDVVAEIGAEFIAVGDPKDHSTVDLIDRLKQGRGAPLRKGAAKPGARASRKGAPAPKAEIQKAPAAKDAAAKTPVAKSPVTKAPVAEAPAAKAAAPKTPVVKAPVVKATPAKATRPSAKPAPEKAPAGQALAARASAPGGRKRGKSASEAHA
jgi:rfaE bifunctional protein nucleotidyltransferase chain/domain